MLALGPSWKVLVGFGLLASCDAKILWSSKPASGSNIMKEAYPIGNGRLGALPHGLPGAEVLTLNLDSLWSGGPFENKLYLGGNTFKPYKKYNIGSNINGFDKILPEIRDEIFANGVGNVSRLLGPDEEYGSYRVLGNLTVQIPSLYGKNFTSYKRTLDLDTGVHETTFKVDNVTFKSTSFCSYPDSVCLYNLESTAPLPEVRVRLNNQLADEEQLDEYQCEETGVLRLEGMTTKKKPQGGMRHLATAQVIPSSNYPHRDFMWPKPKFSCRADADPDTLTVTFDKFQTKHPQLQPSHEITVVVGASSYYNLAKCEKRHKPSCAHKGNDKPNRKQDYPFVSLRETMAKVSDVPFGAMLDRHVKDFSPLMGRFKLELPDPLSTRSSPRETADLIANYNTTSPADPYLDSLFLDHAKYLFISSVRPGSLPPNLQGRWSHTLTAAWSADYHANINLQMNHWLAEPMGYGDLVRPLMDFIEKSWVKHGGETASWNYGIEARTSTWKSIIKPDSGWVSHNEINIFGHTGMKSGAEWANYAVAPAWVLQHAYDHFSYSNDFPWLNGGPPETGGYHMIKSAANFWVNSLQEDMYTKDGTLVANPCNSPEHGPSTFACTHWQQLIYQLFFEVLTLSKFTHDRDHNVVEGHLNSTIANITDMLPRLDKGFHIGAWGQVKEWKLPNNFNLEPVNDTHRHLSELVGWYPGSSLSSYMNGYIYPASTYHNGTAPNTTIANAVRRKLISRGPGSGPDANAGWAKIWRAACWARLNEGEQMYKHLRYAIQENWAGNGLSMYWGLSEPFQIDANLGYAGAVLAGLITDLPQYGGEGRLGLERTVVLGNALPKAWTSGKVEGLRVRGGGKVKFEWDAGKIKNFEGDITGGQSVTFVDNNGTVLGVWESKMKDENIRVAKEEFEREEERLRKIAEEAKKKKDEEEALQNEQNIAASYKHDEKIKKEEEKEKKEEEKKRKKEVKEREEEKKKEERKRKKAREWKKALCMILRNCGT